MILSHGGLMGLGDKEVAVPVNQFRRGSRDGQLVLNLTEQQLKDAPALERSAQWNDPRTWDNVGQYYTRTLGMPATERPVAAGERPGSSRGQSDAANGSSATNSTASGRGTTAATASASTSSSNARFHRVSDVLGMDVVDRTGDEVGEIEDIVINLSNGSIHYAVLEFDRAWNPVDKLVALPPSSLQPKAGRNDLTINMTREQLANAPSFEARKWPDLNDSQFRDRVAGFGRDNTTGMDRAPAAPSSGTGGTGSGVASPGTAAPGASSSPDARSNRSGSASSPTNSTGSSDASGAPPASGTQPR